jgi:hypothetical protein
LLKTVQSNLLSIGRQAYKLRDHTLEQLAHRNYYTARAYYHYKLRRRDSRYGKTLPLLVYQMGKVGSSSVTRSLQMAKIDRQIYHIHFLTPELIDQYEKKRRQYFSTTKEGELKHIWQYQYLNKQIKRRSNGNRWKVVTLVRDPIARNLSTFFENIEQVPSETDQQRKFRSDEYGFEIIINNNDVGELIELFFEKIDHDYPAVYFDREFNSMFDIDLLAGDFPTAKGYKLYQAQKADILLIRLENLTECMTEAFREFLNLDNLTLVNQNIGSQKEYGDIYQLFKDSIRLPESYINRIYSTKFMQHFYSQAEIDRFRTKWLRQPIA